MIKRVLFLSYLTSHSLFAFAQESPPEAASEPAAEVTIRNHEYDSGEITIRVGETVVWVNEGGANHTVTADPELADDPGVSVLLPEGAEPFNSGKIRTGERFAHTFLVPGTYKYFCIPHESRMVGMIHVKSE